VTPGLPLLLFQVGARVFAAPAADVRRIGGALVEHPEEAVPDTALGRPWDARRGLVVDGGGGAERTVLVDGVLGLRAVAGDELIELPAFARDVLPTRALAGFARIDEVPTLVVDLPALVRERRGGAAAAAREETNGHG
jgi:chemotaxis signal transduction protein